LKQRFGITKQLKSRYTENDQWRKSHNEELIVRARPVDGDVPSLILICAMRRSVEKTFNKPEGRGDVGRSKLWCLDAVDKAGVVILTGGRMNV
jgi:hypothetical protein